MDAAEVQKTLELSADEDFILTAWQYRMLQRDIAASKGKHLASKRDVRNSFARQRSRPSGSATRTTGHPLLLLPSTGSPRPARFRILRHLRTLGRRSPRSWRSGRGPSYSSSTCTGSSRGSRGSGTRTLAPQPSPRLRRWVSCTAKTSMRCEPHTRTPSRSCRSRAHGPSTPSSHELVLDLAS
jgi:hypothetical protein